jgi:hypothetical protein
VSGSGYSEALNAALRDAALALEAGDVFAAGEAMERAAVVCARASGADVQLEAESLALARRLAERCQSIADGTRKTLFDSLLRAGTTRKALVAYGED